ncbi:MAG: ATP-dependent metallopeptidase FtsH/Yme1/Tma family protein [Acidimicrobiales bacterium]
MPFASVLAIAFGVLIIGTAVFALRSTRPTGMLGNLRRRKSAVPATTAGGSEQPFQVGSVDRNPKSKAGAVKGQGDVPQAETVTFADVAGLDEPIAELREVVEYLRDPARFQALGAEMPRGILLHGQPGCGKTLLARAVAGETGVPFFFVSATSFVEKFVGLGASRVRQLFESVKKAAPCILFIDELDAIGRHRSADSSGDREFDHTLNALLVELDGFSGASGVMIIGATNRPELIDAALMRPGRFDRRIEIERPDRRGREQILTLYAGRRPVSRRVDWAGVAASTAGLSAAELASVVNESCLLAARRHRDRVTPDDVDEATSRVVSGTRSARLLTDDEKELLATHEAGHALLSVLLRGVEPPARVSIVGGGSAFGKSPWNSSGDREVLTKRELMAQLIVLAGGRAAEVNVFGQPSTRAEDDIEHAADLARRMVGRLAMTGRYELAGEKESKGGDEHRGDKVEVRELLARAEQAARSILADHASDLTLLSRTLVERETLSGEDVKALVRGSRPMAEPIVLRAAGTNQGG